MLCGVLVVLTLWIDNLEILSLWHRDQITSKPQPWRGLTKYFLDKIVASKSLRNHSFLKHHHYVNRSCRGEIIKFLLNAGYKSVDQNAAVYTK